MKKLLLDIRFAAVSAALLFTVSVPGVFAAPSDFTITPALNEPIGVAYSKTANKLLFTTPFCGFTREVRSVTDTGVNTLFATLPPRIYFDDNIRNCYEEYIAVSPGLGGFGAGDVYVTQGKKIVKVSANGATVTDNWVTNLDVTVTHTGIAFDTVGTFGFQMIISGQNGKIFTVSSTGVVTILADVSGLANVQVAVENGEVAPLTWGAYGGWFIVGAEDNQKVFAINPTLVNGQHEVRTLATGEAPETIRFVPTGQLCNFGASGGMYFDIIFGPGPNSATGTPKVIKFPATDFIASTQGQPIVPQEEDGRILLLTQTATLGTPPAETTFYSGLGQQEGSTFALSCPVQNNGCTLTQGGYKNNFNSKVTALTIGGTFYTAAQVNSILQLNAIQGNALLSLAHQLITAKLNVAYGASTPAAVAAAIVQADTIIAAATTTATPVNKIPPVGTATLASGATISSVQTILDNYNNGITGPGHCN
jgi:hypothetical protein